MAASKKCACLVFTVGLVAALAVGRNSWCEIRQPVSLTNPDFTSNLNGWSKTSGTLWTWATDPSGQFGGVARFSNPGASAAHSMWQFCAIPNAAFAVPTMAEYGRKLEFGGWVYVTSSFQGTFYLDMNSVDSTWPAVGSSTNIARTTGIVNATEVPRNKWIYLTTEPASGTDARVQPNTANISVLFVANGTGDIYFDRAQFGLFEYGIASVADRSFEQYDPNPPPPALQDWHTSPVGLAPQRSNLVTDGTGYYGNYYLKFNVAAGASKVWQSLQINAVAGQPHYRQKLEAGCWFRVDSTAGLSSVKLSVVPSGSGFSGAAAIATKLLASNQIVAGQWTFIQASPAASPRLPFLVGSSTVTSVNVEIEIVATATTAVALDYVQVGQLNGITGNPRNFVVADYYPNYRAPLPSDPSYPGWSHGQQWRAWLSTQYVVNTAYAGSCSNTLFQHDPANLRSNLRLDVATSVDNGTPDDVPLVGAYNLLAGNVIKEYHLPLIAEARIDAVASEYYGHALAVVNLGGVTDLNGNGKDDDKWLDPKGPHNELVLETLYEAADYTDRKVCPHFILDAHIGANFLGHQTAAQQKDGIRDDLKSMVTTFYDHKSSLKIDGKMIIMIFIAQGTLLDNTTMTDTDWQDFKDYVAAQTGHEIALVNVRMKPQANYKATFLPSFTGMASWFPFSTSDGYDLRKYASYCSCQNGASCLTGEVPISPAPPFSLGDSYANSLAKRLLQWTAGNDTQRISLGFVYADFDDSGVSGWGKMYESPAVGVRVIAESLNMLGSSWKSVTDEATVTDDQACDWALIATFNEWNEATRFEPAWRQAFFDVVEGAGYDKNAVDQSSYFTQATIDACFGRLVSLEQSIAAFKGQTAPDDVDVDALLGVAGKYLKGTSWPGWE